MSTLLDDNPNYQAVKIIRVDWDADYREEIATELSVPRRSTLVMFKGGVEIARVVSSTSADDIGALFEAAL